MPCSGGLGTCPSQKAETRTLVCLSRSADSVQVNTHCPLVFLGPGLGHVPLGLLPAWPGPRLSTVPSKPRPTDEPGAAATFLSGGPPPRPVLLGNACLCCPFRRRFSVGPSGSLLPAWSHSLHTAPLPLAL